MTTTLILDIESDNLLDKITKIYVIVGKDVNSGQVFVAHNEPESFSRTHSIEEFLEVMKGYDKLVAHNGLGFDFRALKKLYGVSVKLSQIHDTYILSQMLYPNEMHSHGLKAWGRVFQNHKGDHSDFTKLSQEMIDYCIQDVEITAKLWEYCARELASHDWSQAIALEYKHYLYYSMYCNHWFIDVPKAEYFIKLLTRYIKSCESFILSQAPMRTIIVSENVPLRTKSGDISSRAQKYIEKYNLNMFELGETFNVVTQEPINLNSSKQVIDWLLSIGWEPNTWTYETDKYNKPIKDQYGEPIKKSPSLVGSLYLGIDKKLSHALKQHGKASTRLANIKGFLNNIYDGNKIPISSITCGTNTGRHTHRLVVNLPKADDNVWFGRQMRELFIAPEGYKLIGCDAAAIEARIEGHMTYNYDLGEYADFLLTQDIHQFNAESWGVSRSAAKAPYYAMSYGASSRKLESMMGITSKEARAIYEKYWEDRPILREFLSDLEDELIRNGSAVKIKGRTTLTKKRAWIKGIDGRKLWIRSVHSLKNTVIQNAGAVIMKKAFEYIIEESIKRKLPIIPVILYHDEVEVICPNDENIIQEAKLLLEDSWTKSGKYVKMKIDIVGEAKVGNNWAEVH